MRSAIELGLATATRSASTLGSVSAGVREPEKVVRPLCVELQEEAMQRLDALTLDELCGRAHRAGIEGRVARAGDFEI